MDTWVRPGRWLAPDFWNPEIDQNGRRQPDPLGDRRCGRHGRDRFQVAVDEAVGIRGTDLRLVRGSYATGRYPGRDSPDLGFLAELRDPLGLGGGWSGYVSVRGMGVPISSKALPQDQGMAHWGEQRDGEQPKRRSGCGDRAQEFGAAWVCESDSLAACRPAALVPPPPAR